ncbi:hypothetical protein BKP42_67980 [Rhodococcus erythropolis]|nr:hypothetical protein BKP42_67980 [Rhodococcus erythropolis]
MTESREDRPGLCRPGDRRPRIASAVREPTTASTSRRERCDGLSPPTRTSSARFAAASAEAVAARRGRRVHCDPRRGGAPDLLRLPILDHSDRPRSTESLHRRQSTAPVGRSRRRRTRRTDSGGLRVVRQQRRVNARNQPLLRVRCTTALCRRPSTWPPVRHGTSARLEGVTPTRHRAIRGSRSPSVRSAVGPPRPGERPTASDRPHQVATRAR